MEKIITVYQITLLIYYVVVILIPGIQRNIIRQEEKVSMYLKDKHLVCV